MNKTFIEETEKCYLEFEDGHLTCTHNHTLGALCLANKCPYCHELECKCYEDKLCRNKFIQEQQKIAIENWKFATKYKEITTDDIESIVLDTILATEAEIVKNGCVNYEIE